MLAIHIAAGGFTARWITYCEANDIPYKTVDCYKNDILCQLSGCSALLWQYYQGNPTDYLMAKQLMYAVEHLGIKTFPDFKTAWHFDDKVGQKYLLEAIGAPLAQTWVFYDKKEAMEWVKKASFPKVFKLRGGAGSQNVRLVMARHQAANLVRKAFRRGFPAFDPFSSMRERWRRYRLGNAGVKDLMEGMVRFLVAPNYARIRGHEKGYVYFQEFIADNDSDIRVVVIGDKAFAIKRMVRERDFRASGSGNILYDKALIDENIIRLSFQLTEKLQAQCVAFDFVYDINQPLVVEISYGFSPNGYDPCPGYWDQTMAWHDGPFNPYGWMVELMCG